MKINIAYSVLSYIWRSTCLKWFRNYKDYKDRKYWEEHKKKYGRENPDKIFYVIRRRDLYCGLFSLFITNLASIDMAIKKGYIPIIDMQNDFNIYLSKDKIGKENAWEYFFNQPLGYTLKDIVQSKNVVFSSGAVPPMFPYLDINFLTGKTGELEYWRRQVKKYITMNDTAINIIDKEYNKLFVGNERVLGIICRGTDYAAGKPKNHPIQPMPEQVIKKAGEILKAYDCQKVFLATEDIEIYKIFVQHFGSKLLTNKEQYINYKGGSIGKESYEQDAGGYQAGMEYLTSIVLLSKCNCLCGGCVSATVGALLLTEGFEYTFLFDLGIY